MSRKLGSRAAQILRSEMVRRDLSYADLVEMLASDGMDTTEASLRNKVSRGSFTADWFLSVLAVIGVEHLRLTD